VALLCIQLKIGLGFGNQGLHQGLTSMAQTVSDTTAAGTGSPSHAKRSVNPRYLSWLDPLRHYVAIIRGFLLENV
jgi:hypothetical protein